MSCSSVGQSTPLITGRSWVRAPLGQQNIKNMDLSFSEGSEVVIKALYEAGANKEQILGFLREVLENPKYVNDEGLMDKLMIDKLGIDVFITINNQEKG